MLFRHNRLLKRVSLYWALVSDRCVHFGTVGLRPSWDARPLFSPLMRCTANRTAQSCPRPTVRCRLDVQLTIIFVGDV